jgi:hypothetical protein
VPDKYVTMLIQELLEAVGPHERQELALMLNGSKPAALITTESWGPAWAEAARKNGWIVRAFEGFGGGRGIIVARELATATGIVQLFSQAVKSGPDTRFHIQLGRLLGYSTADIAHFLASSTARSLLGPVLATIRSAVTGTAGMAAALALHSGDLNSGEEQELARRRSMPPTIR